MKYHLFIDESGDPSLSSVNSDYPIFVLLGCVIEDSEYVKVCSKMDEFKKEILGTEHAILHSRDIRKCEGVFVKLFDLDVKRKFYEGINRIISEAKITLICVVIKKGEFIAKYGKLADDPYELSLSFLLERAVMQTDNGLGNKLEITIESRGGKEDGILQKRYNKLIDKGSGNIAADRFKKRIDSLRFRRKKDNDCGLQIADLCAYPIARHAVNPNEPYPAYDIVEKKIRRDATGNMTGYGLKVFP